jgi:DNA-directed RNA polymerase sigma subunit (sigma70/sigma32)
MSWDGKPRADEVAAKLKTSVAEVDDLKQLVRTTCSLDSRSATGRIRFCAM